MTKDSMKYAIQAEGINKTYGKYQALTNVSMDIPEGKIFGLLGPNGAGKTTTSAKLANRLKREGRRPLLIACDLYRPAAIDQLATLAKQIDVPCFTPQAGESDVLKVAREALAWAELQNGTVLIFDTAGRQEIDEKLVAELKRLHDFIQPKETLLVADAATGQQAVSVAKHFDEAVGITGIILTKLDGDARGGAALSMRQVTGKPIKLMGTGEKLDGLEDFHPERIAGRILGMGDVVSLVEKAALNIDQAKAQKIAERMKKGAFDLDDLSDQLKQLQKMGGMGGVMNMLPGMGKIKKQVEGMDLDNKLLKRQMAIISSMTPYERRNPKTMDAKRKKRVAAGSGTKVEEINRLLKMHIQMAGMMKQMGQGKGLFGKMMGKGAPDAAELEKMQAELAGLDPNALPEDLKDMMKGGSLPSMPGLPGLGAGKLPGLGNLPGLGGSSPFKGLPGFGKKK